MNLYLKSTFDTRGPEVDTHNEFVLILGGMLVTNKTCPSMIPYVISYVKNHVTYFHRGREAETGFVWR